MTIRERMKLRVDSAREAADHRRAIAARALEEMNTLPAGPERVWQATLARVNTLKADAEEQVATMWRLAADALDDTS